MLVETSKSSAYNRNLLMINIAFLTANLSTTMISPVWPIYIRSLGASMVELGYVFSITNLVTALLQIVSGWLSDRRGRRGIHALGLLMGTVPPMMYAYARSWVDLIPWVMLSGVANGICIPIRFAIVADEAEGKQMVSAYAWQNLAMLTGQTVGPLLGGCVVDLFGEAYPVFTLSFVLMCVAVPFGLMFHEVGLSHHPDRIKAEEETVLPLSFPVTALLYSLINILQGIGLSITGPVLSIFAVKRLQADMTHVGLLLSVGFGVASMAAQLPGAKFAERFGRRSTMIWTALASAPFYSLFTISRSLWEAIVLMFISNLMLGVSWPAFQTLSMELAPFERRGLMHGVNTTSFWIGLTIGSGLSGIVWEAFGMDAPFYLSGLFIAASVAPMLFLMDV